MANIRIVGGFMQADGTWCAAISDGQQWRAKGVGAAFGKALQDAQANFVNGPTRERLYAPVTPRPPLHPLAYVDPTSTRTMHGAQWLEILAWGEALGTLATIETLDGRTGIPLSTTGAQYARVGARWWITVVAAAADTEPDQASSVVDADFEHTE